MRSICFLILLCLMPMSLASAHQAPSTEYITGGRLENIIVFGDSMSDTQNFFILLNDAFKKFISVDIQLQFPESDARQHTQLSNGPLGIEYVAEHYDIQLTPAWLNTASGNNYAVIGASLLPTEVHSALSGSDEADED